MAAQKGFDVWKKARGGWEEGPDFHFTDLIHTLAVALPRKEESQTENQNDSHSRNTEEGKTHGARTEERKAMNL